ASRSCRTRCRPARPAQRAPRPDSATARARRRRSRRVRKSASAGGGRGGGGREEENPRGGGGPAAMGPPPDDRVRGGLERSRHEPQRSDRDGGPAEVFETQRWGQAQGPEEGGRE